MMRTSANAILEAAAKTLAWELYAAAGYSRTRARVSVERFDKEFLRAVRRWRAIQNNLNPKRRNHGERNT